MQAAQEEINHLVRKNSQGLENQLIKKLRTVALFKDLSSDELGLISGEMRLKQNKTGQKLLVQGQPVPAVYIIRRGLVDILVNNDRVAQRGPMDSLGEMSCFSGEERASATAEAVTHCQVWEIDRPAFLSLIEAIPALRSKMFSTVTGRLQALSNRFSEILKHIPHGIIKIDLDGKITDEFSSRCTDYLGITQLTGQKLGNLLFADNTALTERWDQAIRSFDTNAESSLNLRLERLPKEVTYLHPDGNSRIFRLFYHLTVDANERVNGLDIGIDDVSQARQYQSELSLFQNLINSLEQLLVMFEAETGLIVQETFSQSQLGQMHFPAWKNLKGKNIINTILGCQAKDQLDHFQRWLKMLADRFVLETISVEELIELAPRFSFETVLGKPIELSFSLNPRKTDTFKEVLGKFEFLETEQASQVFQYSAMDLMEEVMAAEAEHQSSLMDALNEMQISLEIAQSQMITPNALAINRGQIAGLIHSVKGLGQSFGLRTVATAAHEVEDFLEESLKRGQDPTATHQLHTSFKSLLSLIVVSRSLCSAEETKDLGMSRSREPEIRIPLARFQLIKQELTNVLGCKNPGNLTIEATAALLQLRDEILSLELIKLETVFSRLQRIVTDTARLLNKRAEFKVRQENPVLLDLQTVHRLSTCLIQVVKNAVYHGIETPSDRRFLGKPEKALIELIIEKHDDHLLVCLKDDGKGVNLEKMVERALKLGFVTPAVACQMRLERCPDKILDLLFEPGFSTAASMSLTSGRGVGMSMIKTEMASLGGSVSIDSREDKGTCVSLKVPITPVGRRELVKEADF